MYAPHEHAQHLCHRVRSVACPGFLTVADIKGDVGATREGYCGPQHRQEVENSFSGRSTKYTGGPPILTQVLESIDLCVAYKNAQEASVAEFLETYKPAQSVGAGSPYK